MSKGGLYRIPALRNTFLSEIGIGMLANTVLLLFHVFSFLLGHRPKPTDLPIALLALTHLLLLIIMGFIATDIFMCLWRFWDDVTCKAVIYLHRLMRGFSICTSCLLSVLQAITLSPRGSPLAKFKPRTPQDTLRPLLFLCVFYMSLSSHLLVSIIATHNWTSGDLMYATDSCIIWPISYCIRQMVSTLFTFREVFLMWLMALSSGYMVAHLCRHKRQCQHLHSTSLSPRASPELRATRTILLLMELFMLMSVLDYIISSSRIIWNNDQIFYCIQIFVAHIYATISPLVFICTEKCIINFFKSLWGGP
ncbi:vomeronasal type-1 receptor 94-like [Marmota monax]|uniref:vomeronasal type-1 receptor 94-like n=1 Tax=Marmota monax TaxID=9995 RepID=UPI001EB0062D|nr:vomeronasal type-1 receptor 94-like [Marmota monax]